MRGHIRKREKGVYQLVVEAPAGPDGKRRQQYRTVRGTLKDAQDELNRMLLRRGEGPLARDPSVGTLWDEYVAAAGLAATSAAEAKRARARLPAEFLALGVSRVTGRTVAALFAELEQAGVTANQRRQLYIYLSAAFGKAVEWDIVARNPVRAVKQPAVQRRPIVPPEPGDVARLIAAADPDLRVALLLAATTGMRRGEVVGLRWEDVNLLAGTVAVRRSVAYAPGTGKVVKGTKTERERVAPIGPVVQAALADWYAVLAQVAPPTGYVLSLPPDVGAEPWRPDYLTHRFIALRDDLGLKSVRLHDLRHFVATQGLLAGVDVKTIAGLLGHTQVATTTDRYGAFVMSAARGAVAGLEQSIGLSVQSDTTSG